MIQMRSFVFVFAYRRARVCAFCCCFFALIVIFKQMSFVILFLASFFGSTWQQYILLCGSLFWHQIISFRIPIHSIFISFRLIHLLYGLHACNRFKTIRRNDSRGVDAFFPSSFFEIRSNQHIKTYRTVIISNNEDERRPYLYIKKHNNPHFSKFSV